MSSLEKRGTAGAGEKDLSAGCEDQVHFDGCKTLPGQTVERQMNEASDYNSRFFGQWTCSRWLAEG